MNFFFVILVVGGVFLIVTLSYFVMVYNNLVTVKLNVAKAWANIDVLLKQRHDELPKLIEVCKQYKQFEQSTLEKVVQARNRVSEARSNQDMAQLGAAEGALRLGVGQLFAVAEAYPDLKTNQSFNARKYSRWCAGASLTSSTQSRPSQNCLRPAIYPPESLRN